MEVLVAAFGIGLLVLALSWTVSPYARLRIRRFLTGAGILLLIAVMAIAYGKYH
jgi:hypothetical protein